MGGSKSIAYGILLILFTILIGILAPSAFTGSRIVYVIIAFIIGIGQIGYGIAKGVHSGVKKISKETRMYNQLAEAYESEHGISGKRQLNQDIMKLVDQGYDKKEVIEKLYSERVLTKP